MSEDKDQLRRGIIMVGYRAEDPAGDVLSEHGEVLGSWQMDDEEWCHFVPDDQDHKEYAAPSPWMLHDVIADWYEASKNGEN